MSTSYGLRAELCQMFIDLTNTRMKILGTKVNQIPHNDLTITELYENIDIAIIIEVMKL